MGTNETIAYGIDFRYAHWSRTVKCGLHDHNAIEFVFPFTGIFHGIISSVPYRLRPGQALITSPGRKHSIEGRGRLAWIQAKPLNCGRGLRGKGTWFGLPRRVQEWIAEVLLEDAVVVVGNVRLLWPLLDRMREEVEQRSLHHDMMVNALFQAIVIHLTRERSRAGASGSGASESEQLIGAALEALRRDPGSKWSVQQLSALTGMSKPLVHAAFKEVTGFTPMQYLADVRIELARRLLARPGASVSAVACKLGFSSPQHLSKVFKQVVRMTPTQFVQVKDSNARQEHEAKYEMGAVAYQLWLAPGKTIRDLARQRTDRSVAELGARFERAMGIPLTTFRKRVHEGRKGAAEIAKALLTRGEPPAMIARWLGKESARDFYSLFRSEVGMTPSQWLRTRAGRRP